MTDWTIQLRPFLSGIGAIPQTPRKGRNVYEGYIRACGLKYGNLAELCLADPLFEIAYAEATQPGPPTGKPRTVVSRANLMNIFAILKMNLAGRPQPGHIVEFGSLRGGSAIFMAIVARSLLPDTHVISFDTFCGLPDVDTAIDAHSTGQFETVDVGELRRHSAALGLANLTFIEGEFADTLPGAMKEIGRVGLAHFDCDLYQAVAFSYEETKPYCVPGAYLVFDDALIPTCLGAMEAVEELLIRRDGLHAEQAFPHMVFRAP